MTGSLAGVEVGGLRVAYRRAGQGPPLVLLHGGLGDSREWRRQLEGLADEFTVLAWDAPGCGGSSDPPQEWRLPDYADCLAGFIGALDLDRPHVGGLSWGGGLALELYRRHPDLPRSLVLASAYAGWAGSLPPEVVAERLERALGEAELPPEQWVPGYLPGLFADSVYVRGAMTVHALRLTIGDDAFFRLLPEWTASQRNATATTEEFVELAERISGTQLDDFFQMWLYTEEKPPRPSR